MVISISVLDSTTPDGLQPVTRHHLTQIADLIELCFSDNMDRAGRAVVQDMRVLANLGAALTVVQYADRMLKGLMQGFVWVDNHQVIGNVSIFPAGYDHTWVIANVAVHPDYRGQGIARQLCQAAIQRILEWRGRSVILQVDEDNESAKSVYYRLGFYAESAFTRWQWMVSSHPPRALEAMPYITYRARYEWKQAYQLLAEQRPNERGGLGWLRPTQTSTFRPSLWHSLKSTVDPSRNEEWVIRGQDDALDALLLHHTAFGSSSLRFDLMVSPNRKGELEDALVNYTLRRASDQIRGAYTDHPADDRHANDVFQHYHLRPIRTLIHMRWQPNLV
jgi:ribosomal protein S18 acetylase RimI-like enzyme